MHLRTTTFQMNDVDAAVAAIPGSSQKLATIPGLIRSQVGWNADGSGTTTTVYDSAESADAAQAVIMEIWGGLMPLLAGPPETKVFESCEVMK